MQPASPGHTHSHDVKTKLQGERERESRTPKFFSLLKMNASSLEVAPRSSDCNNMLTLDGTSTTANSHIPRYLRAAVAGQLQVDFLQCGLTQRPLWRVEAADDVLTEHRDLTAELLS